MKAPPEDTTVAEFIRHGIQKSKTRTATISSNELLAAYRSYCQARGWIPLTAHKALTIAHQAMDSIHYVLRRADVPRNGKNCRGYYRVEFTPTAMKAPTTAPNAAENTAETTIADFIRHAIQKATSRTATISTSEFLAAYNHFCHARGYTPLKPNKARTISPEAMASIHCVARRCDVHRNGKNCRGYYGVEFKPAAPEVTGIATAA
jgi:hypothetical protein